MSINPEHRQMLLDSAITAEVIDASGIKSSGAALAFPWNDGVNATVWQYRDDQPKLDDDGRPIKYRFPKGAHVPFNRIRETDPTSRMIIAEGTKQSYAVASHAPSDMAVYGMSGCWGFKYADLTVVKGRDVFVMMDADVTSNADVYAAAEQLTTKLTKHGAASVRYVSTTGTGKEGVDDVLAGFAPEQRAEMMRLWLSQAATKLGKRPKAKATLNEIDAEAVKLFRQRDKPLVFQPLDAARLILEKSPAAITAEKNIALYLDGVYRVDEDAILSTIVGMLGNFYTPSAKNQTVDVLRGLLKDGGQVLPERMSDPLLNCPNGMVDLRTGDLLPHDPAYLSYVQVTTEYRDMPTPVYDAWLREALRQPQHSDADVDALVRDIEEVAGTMLDPSRTPSKALFLFGPSRSGKSTFLRLLVAVAGSASTSAVTLHQLGKDQFATANLYGKTLNVAADLSNEHVSDLSNFKMMAGDDVIQANRKYGQQFSFTNQALFAFSANELPTVSEASRAYAERMKPFEFPNSFAGREDKTLEAKLMAELPGILARWVRAYGRFLARGGYAPTDAATSAKFEASSDRVVQFFQDMCTATPADFGQRMSSGEATIRRDVVMAFNDWAERNGSSKMGERSFFQRFANIPEVAEVVLGRGNRAYNVIVAKASEDVWDEGWDNEPVADPVGPSQWAQDNPWTAPEDAAAPCPVPAASDTVNAPQTATGALPGGTTNSFPAGDPFAPAGDGLNYDF